MCSSSGVSNPLREHPARVSAKHVELSLDEAGFSEPVSERPQALSPYLRRGTAEESNYRHRRLLGV
jgi:hypothetical protein